MSEGSETVCVIDDDPAMRQALGNLLRSVGHAVEAFASTAAFMEGACAEKAGCLVLDVRLPDRSGLEFQRELGARGIDIPIVFITGHGDVPMSVSAMKAGAIEFLTKPFREQDLLDAVHRGLAIRRTRREEQASRDKLLEKFETLTPREREVMALVVEGLLNKQIAGELNLSEATVKVHRAQAMRKLKVRTVADLVRFADRISAATGAHTTKD